MVQPEPATLKLLCDRRPLQNLAREGTSGSRRERLSKRKTSGKLRVCRLRYLFSLLSCPSRPRCCGTKGKDVVPLAELFPFPAVLGVPQIPVGRLNDVHI